jgi:hypothetical protein
MRTLFTVHPAAGHPGREQMADLLEGLLVAA